MGGGNSKTLREVVDTLVSGELRPDDESLDSLWNMDITSAQIHTEITAPLARKLISRHQNNAKKVFKQAVAQLSQVIETPYLVYFTQALTCSRILARILPIMLEVERKSEFIYDLLWGIQVSKKSRKINAPPPLLGPPETPEVVTHSPHSKRRLPAMLPTPQKQGTAAPPKQLTVVHKSQPLGNILLYCIFNLLFLPEFTIPPLTASFLPSEMESRVFKASIVWNGGVCASERAVVPYSIYDANRIDILRLLVSSICSDVYLDFNSFESTRNKFLRFACGCTTPYAEVLLYSLLNTVLGYDPAVWALPFSSTKETSRHLMEVSIDTLLVLLSFGLSYAQACDSFSSCSAEDTPAVCHVEDVPGYNVFRFHLSRIRRDDDCDFMCKGLLRLLQFAALNRQQPQQQTSTAWNDLESKLVALLWRLLDENEEFCFYFSSMQANAEIWVTLLEIMLLRRKIANEINSIYLCALTLLKLSSQRSFAVRLNQPVSKLRKLPGIVFVDGSYSDLIIVCVHKMLVSGCDALFPLFSTLLTIITNISPYIKSMAAVSAIKLVNLFHLFTTPKFIFNGEGNHILLSLLIDTFNNVLQYQYTGNTSLVYAIICRKSDFFDLSYMTLTSAEKGYLDMKAGVSSGRVRCEVEAMEEMEIDERPNAVLMDSDDDEADEVARRPSLCVREQEVGDAPIVLSHASRADANDSSWMGDEFPSSPPAAKNRKVAGQFRFTEKMNNEPAPIVPNSAETAPILPNTSETAPIVPNAAETTPIVPNSAETAPIVLNSTPIVPNSTETVPIVPNPADTAPIFPNSTPIVPNSAETAPIVTNSAETAPVVPNSAEIAPIVLNSAETTPLVPNSTPIVPDSAETAPIVHNSTETAPIVPNASETAPIVPNAAEIAPIVPNASEVAFIAPNSAETTPIVAAISSLVVSVDDDVAGDNGSHIEGVSAPQAAGTVPDEVSDIVPPSGTQTELDSTDLVREATPAIVADSAADQTQNTESSLEPHPPKAELPESSVDISSPNINAVASDSLLEITSLSVELSSEAVEAPPSIIIIQEDKGINLSGTSVSAVLNTVMQEEDSKLSEESTEKMRANSIPQSPNEFSLVAADAVDSPLTEASQGMSTASDNKLVPSQEWLDELKAALQLDTITKLLDYLGPLVEQYAANRVSMDEIFDFIDRTMVIGILPVPHAIVIRKHTSNKQTSAWLSSFVWELIHKSNKNLPYFDDKYVKLFQD